MKANIYPHISVFTVRKCPDCGSTDYERSIIYERRTVRKDGVTRTIQSGCEGGHFWRCLNCGLELLHSFVGSEADRSKQNPELISMKKENQKQ